jgi:hypothetical protein
MKITQYRVIFTVLQNNGKVKYSTKWYDSITFCEKWMNEDDAVIVTREYEQENFNK